MKANAYTARPVTLYRVWGDPDTMAPEWTLLEAAPVMVIFSPISQRYIMSITTPDYRYDAYVWPGDFRYDPALHVPDGAAYYLQQAKEGARKFFQKRVA